MASLTIRQRQESAFSQPSADKLKHTLTFTGGFFDNQTAPEERRAFLLKLLQESSSGAGGGAAPGVTQVSGPVNFCVGI